MVMRKIKITLALENGHDGETCHDILESCPQLEVVASLTDLTGHAAWLALGRSHLLLADEALLLRDGFEPLNMLLSSYPEVHSLLILRNFSHDKMIWALMQGVRGVLTIQEIRPLLVKALLRVMAGEIWTPRHLMQPIRRDLQQADDGSHVYRRPDTISEWVKWH